MSGSWKTLEDLVEIDPEVREAIARGTAVALETSVVAQGLPPPHNLEVAKRCAAAVRKAGAVPAAIAVIGGKLIIGASDAHLERLADPARKPGKAGVRDLGIFLAANRDAGTTVSATCFAAALVGIRLFATGGIGGVHRRTTREEPLDVSSDLLEMSRRAVCVVSAGPKIILDVPATAEHLETLGVPIIGFQTNQLPGFYSGKTGIALEHVVDDPAQAARALMMHWALGIESGVLLAVAPPQEIPRETIEAALVAPLAEASRRGMTGKKLTPFLLGEMARLTGGQTLGANLALLENNARVAGEVAVQLAKLRGQA
jgi:pseudouridine-5'-phosphate glycosidase